MDNLYLLQFFCCIATAMMGFMVIASRMHISHINKEYETSRKILVACLSILSIHFFLQMKFGFRAQGDDVGAVINILFYAPVAFLISFCQLILVTRAKMRRSHLIVSIAGYLCILAVFVVGLATYHSLHMEYALYTMATLYLLIIAYLIWKPFNTIKKMQDKIENETGSDLDIFNNYMRTGTIVFYFFTALTPFAIFSHQFLAILGPLFFISLFLYTISFIALGFNIKPVAEVIEEDTADANEEGKDTQQIKKLCEEKTELIKEAIEVWKEKGGFRDSDITMATMARRIGISHSELSLYISQQCGSTFRVWLSNLRVEEAKKVLISNPNYSMEAIASECGFTSRTYFQAVFKKITGLTPKAWVDSQ